MPLYEYECKNKTCKNVFTELAKFEDKVKCPLCKRATEKLIATTNHPVFVHQTRFRRKRRTV